MSIIDCQAKCWSECPCVAYASTNDDRTGCEIWSKEMQRLFRVEEYYDGQAREIYFLPSNQADDRSWFIDEKRVIEEKNAADEGMPWLINAVGVIVGGSVGFIACSLCYLGWKDLTIKELLFELGAITKSLTKYGNANKLEKNGKSSNELQLFSFQSIATATNNFSTENKLGEGGFGPVYKGVLLDKQEIAIKKLSRGSGQGLEEFKNEILLIGKLQHNNLVRLLGCCIKGEEKILIYEYLPNKSLDFFLFEDCWYIAWELWKEGRILELMDQTMGDLCPKNVIRRCIHVGLLCVQENPIDRPTISEVLSMLSNESMQLSTPKQPAFFIGRTVQESKIPTSRSENCSLNNEMRDWQHLVSANGVFRLEFFSHGTSGKRYLGILLNIYHWPVPLGKGEVWVANRNNPILDTSGSLLIDSDGNLRISSSGSSPIILNSR
ncbi:unnamed protein product, partial [Vitis vinifera]